jgi:hypothetical protein
MKNPLSGLAIASAVAALLAGSALAADKAAPKKDAKEPAKVRCGNINECKGKGECGGATTSCAGTNECKGKGWIQVSEKECKAKKGTVL